MWLFSGHHPPPRNLQSWKMHFLISNQRSWPHHDSNPHLDNVQKVNQTCPYLRETLPLKTTHPWRDPREGEPPDHPRYQDEQSHQFLKGEQKWEILCVQLKKRTFSGQLNQFQRFPNKLHAHLKAQLKQYSIPVSHYHPASHHIMPANLRRACCRQQISEEMQTSI